MRDAKSICKETAMNNRERQSEEPTPTARMTQQPDQTPQAYVNSPSPMLWAYGARVPPVLGSAAGVLMIQQLKGNRAVSQMLAAQKSVEVQGLREPSNEEIHSAAAEGIRTPATTLPFLDRIQASFGRHSIGHVKAHVGPEAAQASRAMNALAFASSDHVVFGGTPDLRTTAHEAAHVVQQQAGVQLVGGIGREGDAYERHADAIADAVVAGQSTEGLLEPLAAVKQQRGKHIQREVISYKESPDGKKQFIDTENIYAIYQEVKEEEGINVDELAPEIITVKDINTGERLEYNTKTHAIEPAKELEGPSPGIEGNREEGPIKITAKHQVNTIGEYVRYMNKYRIYFDQPILRSNSFLEIKGEIKDADKIDAKYKYHGGKIIIVEGNHRLYKMHLDGKGSLSFGRAFGELSPDQGLEWSMEHFDVDILQSKIEFIENILKGKKNFFSRLLPFWPDKNKSLTKHLEELRGELERRKKKKCLDSNDDKAKEEIREIEGRIKNLRLLAENAQAQIEKLKVESEKESSDTGEEQKKTGALASKKGELEGLLGEISQLQERFFQLSIALEEARPGL